MNCAENGHDFVSEGAVIAAAQPMAFRIGPVRSIAYDRPSRAFYVTCGNGRDEGRVLVPLNDVKAAISLEGLA